MLRFGVAAFLLFQDQAGKPGDALEKVRKEHGLPALGCAILSGQGLKELVVVGVRKAGADVDATRDDRWHLGSNTKAMTAALVATLVEQGKVRWEDTVGDCFPDAHESIRQANFVQLLSHRSGLPANAPSGWKLERRSRDAAVKEARGSGDGKFVYSNLGYVVAGAMIEKKLGKSWEELMVELLFKPLGINTAGFGGVGTEGQVDQPWPHRKSGQPVKTNGPACDNPPVLGPAGTVHMSLSDWALFVADQLRGARGEKGLLKPESYRKLHTPPFEGDYALGWVTAERAWGGGRVLTHSGCNTMNYAVVWMAPAKDFAVLVVTNQGDDAAARACDQAASALIRLHGK
jgi:CubicO group peptidase (beta-lactamase class C family)